MHPMTLIRWATGENNPPPAKIVTGIKRDLAALLQEMALSYAQQATREEVIEKTSARDSAVVVGIAIDKLALINELTSERMALVRELFAVGADAGADVDELLRRLTERLRAQLDYVQLGS